jgi:hypothetical protein
MCIAKQNWIDFKLINKKLLTLNEEPKVYFKFFCIFLISHPSLSLYTHTHPHTNTHTQSHTHTHTQTHPLVEDGYLNVPLKQVCSYYASLTLIWFFFSFLLPKTKLEVISQLLIKGHINFYPALHWPRVSYDNLFTLLLDVCKLTIWRHNVIIKNVHRE